MRGASIKECLKGLIKVCWYAGSWELGLSLAIVLQKLQTPKVVQVKVYPRRLGQRGEGRGRGGGGGGQVCMAHWLF